MFWAVLLIHLGLTYTPFSEPTPLARAGFVVSGWLDCGVASGDPCTIGPTITVYSDDSANELLLITLTISPELLEQLQQVYQDEYLSFEVEIDANGVLTIIALLPTDNQGTADTSDTSDDDDDSDSQDNESPRPTATPTKIPVRLPVHP